MRILNAVKTSIVAALAASIVGCGGDGVGVSGTGTSRGLLGSWEYTHENQCKSTFTFNSDLSWTLSSLDEEISGTYTNTDLDDTTRSLLDLRVTVDNGEADCEGLSDYDTGARYVYYIEISNNQMNWYTSVADTTADYTLIK